MSKTTTTGTLTLKQVILRLDQLKDKQSLVEDMQEWLQGVAIGCKDPEAREELLTDIDMNLLVPITKEIEELEGLEVGQHEREVKKKSTKATKKASDSKRAGKKRSK